MVFVVAEIGVNWDGNFELARKMMISAKKVGCDAVKFQAFKPEMVENHPEKIRLVNSSITKNNIEKINSIANDVDIEWFCTPMYPEIVEILNQYVKRFKIREIDARPLLDNKTTPLFEKILDMKKEVIVSSQKSPKNTKFIHNNKIKWLYCVPKYPCNLEDIDFSSIQDFDGYSNHSPVITAPLAAAVLGVKILEIHITSDRKKDFVDNAVSFDYEQLEQLLYHIRNIEKIKK